VIHYDYPVERTNAPRRQAWARSAIDWIGFYFSRVLFRVAAAFRPAARLFRVRAAFLPAARRFLVRAAFWPGVSSSGIFSHASAVRVLS